MYRIRHLLLLATAMMAGHSAQAQTQSPYTYDFNTAIDTSEPDFAPLGWGHLVDAMVLRSGSYYVNYTYEATGGVDNTGCLRIGSQTVTDDLTQTQTLNDILVLPPIGGTVTVDVKGLNYGSEISFYYINYEDGIYTTDGLVDMDAAVLSEDEFRTITLPEMAEGTYIGIRGNSVLIDNVTATTAEVEALPRMKVLNVTDNNPEYVDASSDGNFTLSYGVQFRNNGQRDLVAGEENYSFSLVNTTLNNRVVGTVSLDANLAMGESTNTVVTATIPYTNYPAAYTYAVRNNLTGELTTCGERQAYPYEPVATLLNSSGQPVGNTIDLGIVQGTVTYSYLLRNDGATPLDVTNVSTTGGFSTAFKAQQIAPHATATLPITFGEESTEGNGTLTLETNAGTVSVALKATSVAAGEMYANFENGKMPAGFIVGEGWFVSEFPSQAKLPNNLYCAQAPALGDPTRLVTPLLRVKSGDVLHFDGSRRDDTSVIRVYYSADRKNWTLAHTVEGTGSDNNTFSPFNLLSDSRYSGEFRSYTVENLPTGNYYFAFESGNARLDNIYGLSYARVSHDVLFQSISVPAVATVNTESAARVQVVNNHPTDEAKGAYTVSLYRDGKKVVTAADVDFLAGESRSFDLTFTPHEGGTGRFYALFEADGQVVASSDTVSVEVLGETSSLPVQVGTPDIPVNNNSVPVTPYYKNSESDVIYTAAQLGLEPGTSIKGIMIRGWNEAKEIATNLNVWLCNTDAEMFVSPFQVHSTDTMQLVYSDVVTFPLAGHKDTPVEMLNITFKEPFVYDGHNLSVFMRSNVPSGYANVRFEADKNMLGQAVFRKKDGDLSENEYVASDNGAPVMTFMTVSTASTPLTGKVVTEADGTPVANAQVTLTNNNVQYAATTAEDGTYQLNIFKTDRDYTFRAEAVGYEPYIQPVTGFTDAVNATMKEGHGIYIDGVTLPESFQVNSRSSVSVDVMNVEAADLEANAWTARLTAADGEEIATVATPALKAGEKARLNFRFTPHTDGEMDLRAEFVAHGTNTESQLFHYVVAPEPTGGSVQVLDSTNIDSYESPLRLYDKNSETQTIYTADQLGIPAGSVIHRIAFRGYQNSYSPKEFDANLRVYIENTDQDFSLGFAEADTTAMQKVYDGVLHVTKNGSKKNPIEQIVIDLPEGFLYTGDNLRLAFHSEADNYAKICFVTDKMTKQTYFRGNDNLDKLPAESWASVETPVMYLEVKSTKEITGQVTNVHGRALENVSVQLHSGDVLYSSTTDAEGRYHMTVAQPLLKYNAVFALDGYQTDTIAVNFLKGDLTLDHQMARPYRLTGSVKGFNGAEFTMLADATVQLLQGDVVVAETESNDNGNYALNVRDAEGEYQLVFAMTKYQSDTLTVTFDQQALTREVSLLRLNTLTGTIYGKRGTADPEPLQGATVNVVGVGGSGGSYLLETDADGRYTVDIPAGNGLYGIFVTMEGFNPDRKNVTMNADDTEAPDIILLDPVAAGVDGVKANVKDLRGDVYTLNGELVGRDLDLTTLPKGIYVVNGRKVAVK